MEWPKECPTCGRKFYGRRKYCSYECAVPRMLDAIEQVKKKEGPIYEKWKRNLEAAMNRKFRGGDW